MNFLSKIQGYLIAIGTGLVIAIGIFLKGMSYQEAKTSAKRRKIEKEAQKAVYKAEKAAKEKTDENTKKTDSGDFSGFNR